MEFTYRGTLVVTYGDIIREMAKALALAQEDRAAGEELARSFKTAYATALTIDPEVPPGSAAAIADENLGFLAGEFGDGEFTLVCELFRVRHPVFGTTPVSAEEAFRRGIEWAKRSRAQI